MIFIILIEENSLIRRWDHRRILKHHCQPPTNRRLRLRHPALPSGFLVVKATPSNTLDAPCPTHQPQGPQRADSGEDKSYS